MPRLEKLCETVKADVSYHPSFNTQWPTICDDLVKWKLVFVCRISEVFLGNFEKLKKPQNGLTRKKCNSSILLHLLLKLMK